MVSVQALSNPESMFSGAEDQELSAGEAGEQNFFLSILGNYLFEVETKGQNSEEGLKLTSAGGCSGCLGQANGTDETGLAVLNDKIRNFGLGMMNNSLDVPGTVASNGQLNISGLEMSMETALKAEEIFQSMFPAGKEANSGITANGKVLPQTGMVLMEGQGVIPRSAELDQYTGVIEQLLQKLSGELKVEVQPANENTQSEIKVGTRAWGGYGEGRALSWLQAEGGIPGQATVPPIPTDERGLQSGLKPETGANMAQLPEDGQPVKTEGLDAKSGAEGGLGKNIEAAFLRMSGRSEYGGNNPGAGGSFGSEQGQASLNSPGLDRVMLEDESIAFLPSDLNLTQSLNKSLSSQQLGGSALASSGIYKQIASAVQSEALKQPAVNELEVQLQPEELGKIQISLRWEDGQVHLRCQATESSTGALLQNNLFDLRQSLQSAGIACGNIDMGLGGQSQDNSHFSGQPADKWGNEEEESQVFPEPGYVRLGTDGGHRVNLMA